MALYLIAAIIGIVLGLIGGPATMLIPWGIIGLLIGYFATSRYQAIGSGSVYGFLLSFFFMVHDYSGSAPLSSRYLPFAIIGLFGAVCGAVLALVALSIKWLTRRHS